MKALPPNSTHEDEWGWTRFFTISMAGGRGAGEGCSGEVASSDAASKTQLKSAALPEAPTEI